MDPNRPLREARHSRYASGNDSSFDNSSNERIAHLAGYAHMASEVPRRSTNEVPEGNLIDLDSPPSSPPLIKLEYSKSHFRLHTEGTAVSPTAPNISETTQDPYSTLSQSQRGRIDLVPGGISSQASRRPSPRSNGAMPRPISAKASFYAGLDADCIVELEDYNATEGASIASLFGRTVARPGRIEIFDDVCRKTGAFIKPPVESDRQLFIWGNPTQVEAAKGVLQDLVIRCRDQQLADINRKSTRSARHGGYSTGTGHKQRGWQKISPYYSIEVQSRKEEKMALEVLRKEPEGVYCKVSYPCPGQRVEGLSYSDHLTQNKLVFVWPMDGPSPQACLGKDLEKLDSIRADLQVHAYLDPEDPTQIIVISNEDFDSSLVVGFLRTSWKDGMGRTDLHIKKLMLSPLSPEFSGHGVIIRRNATLAKPILRADLFRDASADEETFVEQMRSMHVANFAGILDNMRTSLSRINHFSDNLRMRVHFGTFILDRYRLPEGDKAAFRLAEFGAMIGQDEAQGHVVPGLKIRAKEVLDRFRHAGDLLEPIGQVRPLDELEFMEPTHSATIEFAGNTGSDLRLELYLKRITNAGEVEVKGHRWFKASRGEEKALKIPLQLAMVDFTRADWQFVIEFFELADERQLSKSQRELSSNIRFTSSGDNHHFVSTAAMNILVSKDTPDARIVKKSAIRFKVKGTSLILELARFDVYRRTAFFKSYSGATLFNPNWDSLMGSQAGATGGRAQSHGADLEAFFPSTRGGIAPEGAGLREVLQAVQRIAELLGDPEIGLSEPAKADSMVGLMDVELGTLF